MNRRSFTASLAALFAAPALPLTGATAVPAAVAVPSQARFWAIYMNSLHGQCTPKTLQVALNIPASQAQGFVSQLIAEGVLKPNPMLSPAFKEAMTSNKKSLLEKAKERLQQRLDDVEDSVAEDTPEPKEELSVVQVETDDLTTDS